MDTYTVTILSSNKHLFHRHYRRAALFLIISIAFILGKLAIASLFQLKWSGRINYTLLDTELEQQFSNHDLDPELFIMDCGYLLSNLWDCVNYTTITPLAVEDKAYIEDHIHRERYYFHFCNQKSNVILIIVESLMSFAVDEEIEGKPVMPFLQNLSRQCRYHPNMISQIEKGMSSDGQFIYFTGLLPLINGVTVSNNLHNKYWGLSACIKHHDSLDLKTAMVIPTTKNFWNQQMACAAYGIDSLYAVDDYQSIFNAEMKPVEWLDDEQLFAMSSVVTKKLSSAPFFLTIVTSSMHMPYDSFPKTKWDMTSVKGYSRDYLIYMEKANYTDACLSSYMTSLERQGLLDNTLVVIVSDHATPQAFVEQKGNNYIPMFIVGDEKCIDYRTIGQVDFYPTMLDLMHVDIPDWRGVGYSIFTPDSVSKIDYESQRRISNMIIRSDMLNQL